MNQPSPNARRALLARAAARRTRDGAVIFVTAMTLAVLTSLALYSLAATRSEVRASGYITREVMSEGIQQWALNLEMNHLNSAAESDFRQARGVSTTSYQTSAPFHNCLALANVPTTAPQTTRACLRQGSNAFIGGTSSTAPQAFPRLFISSAASYNATPDFFTELTESQQQEVPGMQNGGTMQYYLATVTLYGMLRINNAASINTGLEVIKQGRAHLLMGPVSSQ